jgi:hypothetical protein
MCLRGLPPSHLSYAADPDLQDYESSTQALTHLQGSVLFSSDNGPMKIEYAKNQMVIRKEDSVGPSGS